MTCFLYTLNVFLKYVLNICSVFFIHHCPFFCSIDWSAVVVDEAHKIKNPNSQITRAMKDLKCKVGQFFGCVV